MATRTERSAWLMVPLWRDLGARTVRRLRDGSVSRGHPGITRHVTCPPRIHSLVTRTRLALSGACACAFCCVVATVRRGTEYTSHFFGGSLNHETVASRSTRGRGCRVNAFATLQAYAKPIHRDVNVGGLLCESRWPPIGSHFPRDREHWDARALLRAKHFCTCAARIQLSLAAAMELTLITLR